MILFTVLSVPPRKWKSAKSVYQERNLIERLNSVLLQQFIGVHDTATIHVRYMYSQAVTESNIT